MGEAFLVVHVEPDAGEEQVLAVRGLYPRHGRIEESRARSG
jgi:hypothetical protein